VAVKSDHAWNRIKAAKTKSKDPGKPGGLYSTSSMKADPYEESVPDIGVGETVLVGVRMDARIVSVVDELIASRSTPFLTKSDFVRAATTWYLEERVLPDLPRYTAALKQYFFQLAEARRLLRYTDTSKIVGMYVNGISRLVQAGEEDRAVDEYVKAWDGIAQSFGEEGLVDMARRQLRESKKLTAVAVLGEIKIKERERRKAKIRKSK
jgi:hypothetical protein